MSKLPLVDYHTHNGFYRGSLEEWTPLEGWEKAKSHGIQLYGISNKVESMHQEQNFIHILRDEIDSTLIAPILLGIELELADEQGKTHLKPEFRHDLDYILAAPHNQPVKTLLWEDLGEEGIGEYFTSLFNVLSHSFRQNDITVWAHPFLQELEYTAGRFEKQFMPIFTELLAICESRGIALEINENYFRNKTPPKDARKQHPDSNRYYLEKIQTLEHLFSYALQHTRLSFTFGSDTHDLNNVGEIEQSVEFARHLGIPPERILILEREKN